jgi:hypothetical protein
MAFVTRQDEEGFVVGLYGPFPTTENATIWADEKTKQYDGDCQEPYAVVIPQDPNTFDDD